MTRKDFQLIAEVLAQYNPDFLTYDSGVVHNATIASFADRLADTNPNFDRDRFVAVATGKRER